MTRVYAVPLVAQVIACGTAEASRELEVRAAAAGALLQAEVAREGASSSGLEEDEDKALRRSYGAKEMKVHVCASFKDARTIIGQQCPAAIVVFGPYATVPAGSDVKLTFNIVSPSVLGVRSDFVSDGAKRFHAAVEEQVVDANQPRAIGYRVRIFETTQALEARIGISAGAPVDFSITDIVMSVQ